jgi:FkbM family methyltransferase
MTGVGTIRHGAGAGLRFDAADGHPGYLLGTSEPLEQEFLAERLHAGDVLYDLGANIGFYSTIAARLVGAEGRVYAFEPHPDSAATARRNASLNGFGNIEIVQAAVSARRGRRSLQLADSSASHRLGDGPGIDVDVLDVDGWAAEHNARPPTVVMIDVEGEELNALAGMHRTLTAHRPIVCVEVHWIGDAFVDYHRQHLAPLGYGLRGLDGPVRSEGRWHCILAPAD